MDIKTILFGLAITNFIFGFELILFEWREERRQIIPFWVAAKFLQSAGWFFLYMRGSIPDTLSIFLGNSGVFCGVAYECWAMFLTIERPVSRRVHVSVSVLIILICAIFIPLPTNVRIIIASAILGALFFVSAWVMLSKPKRHSVLRFYMGWSMAIMAILYTARIFWAWLDPDGISLFTADSIQVFTFSSFFFVTVANGFGMLLLSKESTDLELKRALHEQKSTLLALQESEIKYRALFNDAPVLMWEYDFSEAKACLDKLKQAGIQDIRKYFDEDPGAVLDCLATVKIVNINRAALLFFGARDLSHLKENLFNTTTEESIRSFKNVLIAVAEGDSNFQDETTQRTLDKEIRYVSMSAFVAPSDAGNLSRVIISMLDITARKQVELENIKFRNAVDQSADIIFIADRNGIIEYVNPVFEEVTGYKWDSCIGKTPSLLKSGLMETGYSQKVWGAILAGKLFQFEVIDKKKTGEFFYYDQTITPVKDSDGNITHFVSTGKDVTKRRQMEDDLRKLTRAVEQSPVSIVITDLEGAIEYVNPRFTQVTGYSFEEAIGKNPRILKTDLTLPETHHQLWEMVTTGKEWRGEFVNHKKDGSLYYESAIISPVTDQNGVPTHYLAVKEDITERKRAEETLRASEQRFAEFMKYLPGYAYIQDAQRRYVYANQAFEEFVGSVKEGWRNKTIEQLLPASDIDRIQTFDESVLTYESPHTGEETIVKDGQAYTYLSNKFPIRQPGGSLALGGISIDITDRRKAEEKLRKSEERYYDMITDLQVGVLVQGPQAEIILSNQKALNLLGFTEDQLLGKTSIDPDWNVIHEDGTPFPGETHPVPEAIATRQPVRDVVMGVYRPATHDRVWLLVNADPQLNPDGSIQQVVCTFNDITARKQAEKALRESEKKFRDMAKNIPSVIYQCRNDSTYTFLYLNNAVEELTGYSPDAFLKEGLTFFDLYHPDDLSLLSVLSKTDHLNDTFHITYRIRHKSGEWRWVEEWGTYLFDNQDEAEYINGVMVDITARKQAEEALRESEQRLKLATRAGRIGIWDWDIVNDRQVWGDIQYTLYGLRKEEFANAYDSWIKVLHPDDREYVDAEIQAALRGEREYAPEFRITRGDGEIRVMKAASQTLYDENDKAVRMIGVNIDITERKRMESALQESERFAHSTLDALSAHIAILDETGKILAVNRAWREFGRANSAGDFEIVYESTNYLSVCDAPIGANGEEAPAIAVGIRTVMSGKQKEFSLEYPCHSPTERRWFNARVTRFLGEGDLRVVVAHENITERKKAEEALRKNETLLNLIINTVPQVVFWKDLQGRYLGSNRAFANTTGLDLTQVLGKTDFELSWPHEDAQAYQSADREVIEKNSPTLHVVSQFQQIDGTRRWIDTSKIPLLDTDGKPFAILGISEDITERMLDDERLRRQNEYLSSLQQITMDLLDRQTPEALFSIIVQRAASLVQAQEGFMFISEGDDLVMRVATQGFAHRIGSRDEKPGEGLLGRVWQDQKPIVLENYQQWEFRDSSYESENIHAIAGVPVFVNNDIIGVLEVIRTEKGGQIFTAEEVEILTRFSMLASLILDNSNLYTSALNEIAERKQAEESMMLAHDQAVKANQLKSQLIAKVSHELRTPLSSVLGFAELLKFNILGGELNTEQLEATDQIIDSAHYLTDMVNEFLDEAEIESRSLMLEHNPLVIADILKNVKSTMSIIANKKGLELKTYLAPDLPEMVWGDARRLQQIMINLTNNAIKFTRAGEVNINIQRHSESHWALEVKDTGVGIPKDAQEMIFEPFKQIDNAITRANQGTGLGLTITKQLVELMNGIIFVESEVEKGSTFTIVLPIQHTPKTQ